MAEKISEGVRRLSLVLGIMGLIPWGVISGLWVSSNAAKLWHRPAKEILEEKWAREDKDALEQEKRVEDYYRGSSKVPELTTDQFKLALKMARKGWIESLEKKQDYEQAEAAKELFSGLALGIVAFVLPWGIVRVIAWVVAGFRKGQS